jgi:hypothetical protein
MDLILRTMLVYYTLRFLCELLKRHIIKMKIIVKTELKIILKMIVQRWLKVKKKKKKRKV